MLWHDRRLIEGGTRLDFDRIRQTTLRPFGLLFMGPARAGQTVEVRIGFSLRGCEQARENLRRECGEAEPAFDRHPGPRPAPAGPTTSTGSRSRAAPRPAGRCFATALYHALIKPCFGDDESPWWPASGPFAFDICTMWDIYKTQIPLLMAIASGPGHRPAGVADPGLRGGGQLPDRLPDGARRGPVLPAGQRAGAHRAGRRARARACELDWSWALVHMADDLRRLYGEDFIEHGFVHPITHTLDLAYAHHCTAQVARALGDKQLADELDTRSRWWVNAFDPATGLLRDSEFYEGGKWNYSFRLLHDMRGADRAGRRRRRVRRHAGRLLRLRGGRGDPARPVAHAPRRWRSATR